MVIEQVSDEYLSLRFDTIPPSSSWHTASKPSGDPEKYGVNSEFYRVHRFEDPFFVESLNNVLRQTKLAVGSRILILGVNRGDEIAGLKQLISDTVRGTLDWVGIDHCKSAIDEAKRRFSDRNVCLICQSIEHLGDLNLGRFNLVIAINTLHSPTVDGQAICRQIVKHHLEADAALVFGFPNCRYHGPTIRFGARAPNYQYPEYSVLFRQVNAFRRYLNQQGFRTTLTGKYTIQLAAFRTRK